VTLASTAAARLRPSDSAAGHFGKAGLDGGHRLVFQRGRDEVARPEDVQRQLDNLGLAAGRLEVWEDEATEFLQATVDAADADGRLRGILDAVRSNRVEDDFSGHWSHAHEDFERKLYRKRSTARSALTSIPAPGATIRLEPPVLDPC
jgi:hypothetical protein